MFGQCGRPCVAVGALALSLRMNGHMQRFRDCMRTIVESKLTLQGACRRGGRLPLAHIGVVLGKGPMRCQVTVFGQTSAPSSTTSIQLGPSPRRGNDQFLGSRQPSRHGSRPCYLAICERGATSLATGSACCTPSTMSCTAPNGSSLCRKASSAPDLSCQRQGHQRQRRCQKVQLHQRSDCNDEDEDGDDDSDGCEDELALQCDAEAVPHDERSSELTETDWHTVSKQCRLEGTISSSRHKCCELVGSLSNIFLPLTCSFRASRGRRSRKLHIYRSVMEWLAQNLDNTVRALLQRVAWRPCLRDFSSDALEVKCLPAQKRTVDVQHFIFKILSRLVCAAPRTLVLASRAMLTHQRVHAKRKTKVFTVHILVPQSRLFSQPLVFVCLFVLCGVVGRHEFGESTAITHRLNDWAVLMHLSSPFWSKQHSNRGQRSCAQSWLLCRRLLLVFQRREST